MTLPVALKAHQSGRLDEAENAYRLLLRREPRNSDALYLLALLLHQTRRSREALEPLERLADTANPRPEHLNTLGDVHRALGEYDQARIQLERAIALRPGYVEAIVNLANTLNVAGRINDALVLLFNSVAAQPTAAPLRLQLGAMLNGVALQSGNELVREVLRLLCTDDAISAQSLSPSIFGLIKRSASFQSVLACVARGQQLLESARDATTAMMHDALLVTALPRLVVTDLDVENALTALRREIQASGTIASDRSAEEFFAALAQQAFNTEYSWAISEGERARLERVTGELGELLSADSLTTEDLVAPILDVALYAPLSTVTGWERLTTIPIESWSEAMRPVIREHIHDHAIERALAEAMPSVTSVNDDTSHRVREMYESNPYPRWVTLQQPPASDINALVRSLRPENSRRISTHDVLVAGCGSGQQPIQLALTLPDADVLGVDLSVRSLAYATRMANQFEVSNVRFAHGDLLELDVSLGPFAIVSCSGVLHHLSDPMGGWRKLLSLLAPDGVMKIGLYSTTARSAVNAAREFVRDSGFDATDDGMRACRSAISALPASHQARAVVEFVDFFSLSGLRDLIMHVQERSYTIPELAAAFDELQLRFLGFQLPQAVQAKFHAEYGRDAVLDLHAWEQFETKYPSTFAGMYQFWTAKRDGSSS